MGTTTARYDKLHPGIDRSNAVVSLRNVKKAFGSLQVLKGIDLDVWKGRMLWCWVVRAAANPCSSKSSRACSDPTRAP
ncbi:hypothetical protein ACQ86N_20305 [Puia sp. P3]|uniref:hypothetical protein n=1 Tax=Puia sp. P3 TaxID=3423952 RepID=UPI003D6776D3